VSVRRDRPRTIDTRSFERAERDRRGTLVLRHLETAVETRRARLHGDMEDAADAGVVRVDGIPADHALEVTHRVLPVVDEVEDRFRRCVDRRLGADLRHGGYDSDPWASSIPSPGRPRNASCDLSRT